MRVLRHLCSKGILGQIVLAGILIAAPAFSAINKAVVRISTETQPWQTEVSLPIIAKATAAHTVDIDTATKYQQVMAFGGSPNIVGCQAMWKLPQAIQDSIYHALFDSVTGCKFNQIRLPIGCSDFSDTAYTLDDSTGDLPITHISIDREKPYTLKFIKDVMAKVRPDLKVWGSPWTAPKWMKRNGNWFSVQSGGDDCPIIPQTTIYTSYALYFSKAVSLYRNYGIPFYALAFQNEPQSCQNFPSMKWENGDSLRVFLAQYLVPRWQQDKLFDSIELWTPTMDLWDTNFYMPMLRDPVSGPVVKAVGFQYAGFSAINYIHTKFPNLKLYGTELNCGSNQSSWGGYALPTTVADLCFLFAHGADGVMQWNLMLEKHGNAGYNWSWNQMAMIYIDTAAKTFTRTCQYYAIKHFSYYMQYGGKFVKHTANYDTSQASVKNPDGSVAVVLRNYGTGSALTVAVSVGNQMVNVTLPNASLATVKFLDSTYIPVSVINSARRTNFMPVNKSFKVAGVIFSIPMEYSGKIAQCAVYDLQGKLLREFSTRNRAVDLSKDFGMSQGIYMVRVKAVREID
jgi:glucosylceramidase